MNKERSSRRGFSTETRRMILLMAIALAACTNGFSGSNESFSVMALLPFPVRLGLSFSASR